MSVTQKIDCVVIAIGDGSALVENLWNVWMVQCRCRCPVRGGFGEWM